MREASMAIGVLWSLSVGGYALWQATHPDFVTPVWIIALAGFGLFIKTLSIYRYEGTIARYLGHKGEDE